MSEIGPQIFYHRSANHATVDGLVTQYGNHILVSVEKQQRSGRPQGYIIRGEYLLSCRNRKSAENELAQSDEWKGKLHAGTEIVVFGVPLNCETARKLQRSSMSLDD